MITHDRDYFRCLDDAELMRLARDSGHELAIVLGERLAMLPEMDTEMQRLQYAHEVQLDAINTRLIYWQHRAADATLRAVNADAALQAARDPGDD
jgi:hypothetical protein